MKTIYGILWGIIFSGSIIFSMQESVVVPQALFLDGGKDSQNIGKLNFPQLGVYATPYAMCAPLFELQSRWIIQEMPEVVRQHVVSLSGITGTPEAVQKNLADQVTDGTINVAIVIWQGLASKPAEYNLVFHPIVREWLHKKVTESFDLPIEAGIFLPKGITPASRESIPFHKLGSLQVNLHDIDNYSPNNGKFAVMPGRSVATFWAVGARKPQITISYNILLIDAEMQKKFEELGQEEGWQAKSTAEKLRALLGLCERLTKRLDSEDKPEDSAILYSTIELLRRLEKLSQLPSAPVLVHAPTLPVTRDDSSR